MPSIHGIEIRDVQQEETLRGIAYQAALYMDGERIGFFENRGNGGATNVMVLNKSGKREEFQSRVSKYYEDNPSVTEGEEEFVEELMGLWDDFEVYKKRGKGKVLVAAKQHTRMTPAEEISMDDLVPKYYTIEHEDQLQGLIEHVRPQQYRVYRSEADFHLK